MKTIKLLLLSVATVIFISCNGNRTNRNVSESGMVTNNSNTSTTVTGKDADFVKEAANGGMMEVELGKYAGQNALNTRVKNFGAMMVRDHSKANDELRSIATGKNIAIPDAMESSKSARDLKTKTGKDFDKDYMKDMVDDHTKDIEEFKKQAENGSDAEVKAFASKCIPVLQTHLDSAKVILQALK
jgi:putative membrane protein